MHALATRQRRLERHQELVLGALRALLCGEMSEMSRVHEEIAAAIAANNETHNELSAKLDRLLAMKEEGDKVFADVLEAVRDQGVAMRDTHERLDAVLRAEEQGGAGEHQAADHEAADVLEPQTELVLSN